MNVRFLNSNMSRHFYQMQLMIAPFKISHLTILIRRKSQFLIMLSYRMIKLSDASKAVSKMTHMRISLKQRIRF